MAESKEELGEDLDSSQFCCSVCLDLLKDPVTIPCGHSYCKVCIESFWDQNEEKGNCTCPQCRQIFNPRPVLAKNHILAEVVEMLKRKGTQQTTPSLPEAAAADAEACTGPGDVPCDFCCGTNPRKATMTCLACVASYCPVHIEPHYNVPVLKKHQLVSTIVPLQEKMCTMHNKLMEVYCRTDNMCICYLCSIDWHNGHQTVSTEAERIEQQEQLSVNQNKVRERRKEREKELTELLKAQRDFKKSMKTAVETSHKIFGELKLSFQQYCTLVDQLILAQDTQAEDLQLRLEEEISKLKKRDSELEQISHVDDHIHFIQTFQTLSASCESPDLPDGCVVCSRHTFKEVTDRLFKLKTDVEGLLKDTWPSITSTMSAVKVLKHPDPKTREDFLRYSRPLKLDERAVSKNLTLSQDHLRATCKMVQRQNYNSYSRSFYETERIAKIEQVWCCEALTERCYWEISFYGSIWCVAVSYKDKNETPSYNSVFGLDNRSWSLGCSSKEVFFSHNNQGSDVTDSFYCHHTVVKIGVYLDYLEGILAFYAVDGSTMTLLHRVENIFTEPLYPCIGFIDDGYQKGTSYYAELVKLWKKF